MTCPKCKSPTCGVSRVDFTDGLTRAVMTCGGSFYPFYQAPSLSQKVRRPEPQPGVRYCIRCEKPFARVRTELRCPTCRKEHGREYRAAWQRKYRNKGVGHAHKPGAAARLAHELAGAKAISRSRAASGRG